ncbi:MAG: uracil-DNA glycosylase [Candidatus Neomarinimicrobiota bacterium]
MGPFFSDDLRRYLKQTRELYGDELFLDLKKTNSEGGRISEKNAGDYGSSELDDYESEINRCQKCSLGSTRNKFVFGVGDPGARLLLVGEAPGAEEDKIGQPFVGRAGKLLDKILAAIKRDRYHDVYICNVLKCRPPSNRNPLPVEVESCEPHLLHQIYLIKPELIVALGRVAGMTLLNVDKPLKTMRGLIHDYHGTPLIVTYHPAALLRNSNWKPEAWKDFKWIKSILDDKREG